MITLSWSDFKAIVDSKRLKIQYTETTDKYLLYSVDGSLEYNSILHKNISTKEIIGMNSATELSNVSDFEDNYKTTCNQVVAHEIATVKMVRGEAATVSGVATVDIIIPGTPGTDLRAIKGGEGWFETPAYGDYAKVYLVDKNGIQYPADTVIGSFTDDDADTNNQGWYICKHDAKLRMEAFEILTDLPAGMCLRVIATKGDETSDTFRVNLWWGKRN